MIVSIIVPIYNTQNYLERCFQSIVANNTREYEVLLVNDGSTDHGKRICQKVVDRYPDRFRLFNKENGGLSSARNYGIRQETRGRYLMFLDPDDYLEAGFLDRVCRQLSEKGQAELYEFGYVVHQKGKRDRVYLPPFTIDQDFPVTGYQYLKQAYKKYRTYSWASWKYIIEKEFFQKTGLLFEEGRNYEDILLMPQLILRCKKISTIPCIAYHYTSGRPGSITQTFTLKNELDKLYAASRGIQLFSKIKENEFRTLAQNSFSMTYYSVLPSLYMQKDRQKRKILEQELLKKKAMINYTISGKHKILKNIVKLYGIYFCGFLLLVRRKWKHLGEMLFYTR